MSTKAQELKAALPTHFLGEPADTVWWIKAMKAYFSINSSIYVYLRHWQGHDHPQQDKQGTQSLFLKDVDDKMADTSVANSEKTFDKFASNFEFTFFPYDTKATTRFELTKLAQKSFKCPDSVMDDGFQKYITDFQNLASKAGTVSPTTLPLLTSSSLDSINNLQPWYYLCLQSLPPSWNGLNKPKYSTLKKCESLP